MPAGLSVACKPKGGHPTLFQGGLQLCNFAFTAPDLLCRHFICWIIRVNCHLIFQNHAGEFMQPVGHTSQRSGDSAPLVAKSRVFGFADCIMLTGDSSPMIDGVVQLRVDDATTHRGTRIRAPFAPCYAFFSMAIACAVAFNAQRRSNECMNAMILAAEGKQPPHGWNLKRDHVVFR